MIKRFVRLFEDLNRRVLELESQLVESQNELEKVRNLLVTQHKINREYKSEVKIDR